MQAVLAESRDKDYVGAKELLENALKETLPELQVNEIGKSVLGESEIILLLMKLEIDQKIGEGVPVEAERKILSYIQTHVEDEEAKANIYSKAAWGIRKNRDGKKKSAVSIMVYPARRKNTDGKWLTAPFTTVFGKNPAIDKGNRCSIL